VASAAVAAATGITAAEAATGTTADAG